MRPSLESSASAGSVLTGSVGAQAALVPLADSSPRSASDGVRRRRCPERDTGGAGSLGTDVPFVGGAAVGGGGSTNRGCRAAWRAGCGSGLSSLKSIAWRISVWKPCDTRRTSPMTLPAFLANSGRLIGAEHQQRNEQDHEELTATDVEHGASLPMAPATKGVGGVNRGDLGGGGLTSQGLHRGSQGVEPVDRDRPQRWISRAARTACTPSAMARMTSTIVAMRMPRLTSETLANRRQREGV